MVSGKSGSYIPFIFLSLVYIPFSQTASPPFYHSDTAGGGRDSVSEFELLEIDGSSRFTAENPHVGDTLSYIITVEWINPKVPFFVLAPESLIFSGFHKEGAATEHKKISKMVDGKPALMNKSEFKYILKAMTPGSGKASSARLPYYTALSQEKEYLIVSPHLINILPAKTPLTRKWYFKVFLWILIILLLSAAVKYSLYLLKRKKQKAKAEKPDFNSEMKDLKSRLQFADSKDILLQMENISLRFLQQELPTNKQGGVEALMQSYLENTGGKHREQWLGLQKDFELAKFGGGQKASHELLESYKTLKTCLNLKEEEKNE